MILAAGRGERLRPLTDHTPKPLIQVGAHTLIEHHLIALSKSGIVDIVINLAHLGNQIRDCLGAGEKYGVRLSYSEEPAGALETAGGIRHALRLLGNEPFLVVNGDIRCAYDFSTARLQENRNMHLVMVNNPPHHREGDFWLDTSDETGLLRSKNSEELGLSRVTFSGIGVYRPTVFDTLPAGRAPLAPLIQQQIAVNKVTAELFQGYWADIGTAQRLQAAREYEEG